MVSHRPLLLGLDLLAALGFCTGANANWSADLGPLGLNLRLSSIRRVAAPRARIRTFRPGEPVHAQHLVTSRFAVNRQTLHVLKWAQSGYHPLSLKSNATFRCTSPSPLFGARLACSTSSKRPPAAVALRRPNLHPPYQAGSKLASLLALPPLRPLCPL
nr:hypothetical protein [uncultured bacterium]